MSAVLKRDFVTRGDKERDALRQAMGAATLASFPYGLSDVPPEPRIRRRHQDAVVMKAAEDEGFTPLQARVIAGRMRADESGEPIRRRVMPRIADLDSYTLLPDIEPAVARICHAIEHGEVIAPACDHDADGSSSMAVIVTALVDYFHVPAEKVVPFNSHRMKEGYGVSHAVVDRILQNDPRPSLIITGDQGAADHERITRLAEEGIDTVVTDHHEIPAHGVPRDAVAVVNPTRLDSVFPDKNVAGCHVAWLVMCAVRAELIRRRWLPSDAPRLGDLLDWVALGSACDAVSLAKSINNRALITHGLRIMNSRRRPAWEGMAVVLGKKGAYTAPDLSWKIGPRLNARSRLSEAMTGVHFLMSKDHEEAVRLATVLDADNKTRRAIEKELTEAAMTMASLQASSGSPAIVIRLENGHAGIHGISASRLCEAFGRPAVMLSPKEGEPGIFTGSLRTAAHVNVKQALDCVNAWHPGLLISYGGHHGAGGCRMRDEDIERFQELFCDAVLEQVPVSALHPLILSDGELDVSPTIAMVEELAALEPYGREFEPPIFHGQFRVMHARLLGADKVHLKLQLQDRHGQGLTAIWFGAIRTTALRDGDSQPPEPPVAAGDTINAAFALRLSEFNGNTTLDLEIKHARRAA
ncbi:single-stranded DNA exonuclease (plasmid) [Xanthomonas citri pv. citri]|uniref:single-stranded-DNA-specific exonuclease RecJ n=1 Tax=Xanthomonas citri TaxID=346 RepID=UPI00193299B2|nr:DHHA1 domain-containing protein [Xanthomonas citri]QRD62709.1 single-stranded DNA exonuclease [Xanthomonas citri pv. citri]QRD67036.1 single-stranded DNA exonuclease [Xanthomonas citri pv. citri]QRD71711.1 single-stranded DNA exonuclease [Xanthomonas citri pv. citri]